MKNVTILIILGFYTTNLHTQGLYPEYSRTSDKSIIDSSSIRTWPFLRINPAISNDGRYFMYEIGNRPVGGNTLVVKSIEGEWQKEYEGVSMTGAYFSGDSRFLIFQNKGTLCFLNLLSGSKKDITNIDQEVFPNEQQGRWIAYRIKGSERKMTLYDLFTGVEKSFADVDGFWFDKGCNTLLLKNTITENGRNIQKLKWINLSATLSTTIWSTQPSSDENLSSGFDFDESGSQLVFVVESKDASRKKLNKSIWYYKSGMDKAVERVGQSEFDGTDTIIVGSPKFISNGKWILFNKQKVESNQVNENLVKVNVWRYNDPVLQPEQGRRLKIGQSNLYTSVVSAEGGKAIQLNHDDESVLLPQGKGDFAVIRNPGDVERWCRPKSPVYVVSLKDGSRTILSESDENIAGNFSFSPEGKWLVYFDKKLGAYFSYDLLNRKARNITKNLSTSFLDENNSTAIPRAVANVAGWMEHDKALLLYDNYDIWQVDPSDVSRSINLTNGYGRRHKIKLRLVDGVEASRPKSFYTLQDTLLISGFSVVNKYNGFFSKTLNHKGDPELLYIGPYTFYRTPSQKPHGYAFDDGMQPLKAGLANVYVLKRQTAKDAPNYFFTKDFKTFKPLTNLEPQKLFNWITSELVTWRQLDGTLSQGVLYTPENFDSTKKYPLLFNYYEQLSHRLYEFPQPGFTGNNIDIPWFVSRGYLVFTPDIHYKLASISGKTTGEWAYNSIVSAAQYLSKLPYVDSKKMGIQGHSFGGGETNYLVTHTNIFAAANEFAGASDAVSSYLTLIPFVGSVEHASPQSGSELGQGRLDATPWERPDLYWKKSAVMNADKITAPLLIVHNEKDNNIPWRQGIELYMALRRLQKKVWMLQYDNGNHNISKKEAVDFTIRLTQYFDHYLKDAPAPTWMTQGIPARLKQIETGYAYDPSGNCGKDCKVCKMWNERVRKDSAATWKEIEQRKISEHWQ